MPSDLCQRMTREGAQLRTAADTQNTKKLLLRDITGDLRVASPCTGADHRRRPRLPCSSPRYLQRGQSRITQSAGLCPSGIAKCLRTKETGNGCVTVVWNHPGPQPSVVAISINVNSSWRLGVPKCHAPTPRHLMRRGPTVSKLAPNLEDA